MRQLSKRTHTAQQVLYALTRTYGAGPQLITNLAHDETIPKKFLEQILVALKSGGFVASKKGKGGGYCSWRNRPTRSRSAPSFGLSKGRWHRCRARAKHAFASAMSAPISRPAERSM